MRGRTRRGRAWASSFEVAVEVFRLTAGVDEGRTNGFVARMRQTALRAPTLVSRAAARTGNLARRQDLDAAAEALAVVDWQLQMCVALSYAEPGEARRLGLRAEAARRWIRRLSDRLAPAAPVASGASG